MELLLSTCCGIVENVSDPLKLGRVKVRVPHVYGATAGDGATSTGFVGTNDLPWALPSGMPAGGGPSSGGFSHLPDIGDHVYVRFLDGEPEKPIWEWAMQTMPDAESLLLHQYTMIGTKVGKPKRAGWTRYGHTIELNEDSVIVTSSQGYRATFTDGDPAAFDGVISLATPGGNMLEIADSTGAWTAYAVEDLYLNVGDSITALARSLDFTIAQSMSVDVGTDVSISTVGTTTLTSDAVDIQASTTFDVAATDMSLQFATLRLNAGVEPYVLGIQLVTFLDSLMLWLTTHTHGNGNLGAATTPPIVPPEGAVLPLTAELVSAVIFGE